MTDFDVIAAIAEFVADSSRSTLELPHMTTGQRKKAKALVENYPEIKCESFGFGAERQLHLFKVETDTNKRVDSSDCSTGSYSGNGSPQSINRDREVESMQPFVNVRNTFINLETTSIDERTVQSMPHGMFGKCMLAEMSHNDCVGKSIVEEKTLSSEVTLDKIAFSVGTLVIVDGLVKAPAFNGLTAVVQGFDEASERYRILIGSNGRSQQAMVKEENLKLVLPCP